VSSMYAIEEISSQVSDWIDLLYEPCAPVLASHVSGLGTSLYQKPHSEQEQDSLTG
jgi:hypothetical protein